MKSDFSDILKLLDQLSQKERKIIRKHSAIFHGKTKESRFLDMIDSDPNKISDKDRIMAKLGYAGPANSGLKKFYYRLKKRIFEFFISDESMANLKEENPHAYYKCNAKKMTLAASIAFQRELYDVAKELLDKAISSAQKHENKEELIEALRIRKNVALSERVYQESSDYRGKINTEREQLHVIELATERFSCFIYSVQCQQPDFIDQLENQIGVMSAFYEQTGSSKIDFFLRYLVIVHEQLSKQHTQALKSSFSLLRILRAEPAKFPNYFQLMVYRKIGENLLFLGRTGIVRELFEKSNHLQNAPVHATIDLQELRLWFHYHSSPFEETLHHIQQLEHSPKYLNFYSLRLASQMIKAHLLFKQGHIRASLRSLQSLTTTNNERPSTVIEVKILEIMCLIELRETDLLEHKVDAFHKYVGRLEDESLPSYYLDLEKTIHCLRNTSFQINEKEATLINQFFPMDLRPEKPTLQNYYTFQPSFFFGWIRPKVDSIRFN